MTPEEHYQAGEDLLDEAAHSGRPDVACALAARAQAHFAAATAAAIHRAGIAARRYERDAAMSVYAASTVAEAEEV